MRAGYWFASAQPCLLPYSSRCALNRCICYRTAAGTQWTCSQARTPHPREDWFNPDPKSKKLVQFTQHPCCLYETWRFLSQPQTTPSALKEAHWEAVLGY